MLICVQWLHLWFGGLKFTKYGDNFGILVLCMNILCFRMERYNEMSQEVDLYCTTNTFVLQQLESEIAKVEQVLKHLEAGGTLHKIDGHERKFLEDYLDVLYQFRAFISVVVKYCSTMLLKNLQVIFRRNDGRISTCVEVQLLKHGAVLPAYLAKSISPLSVVKKGGIRQCGDCTEMAAMLSDGLYMVVPINTLTVCPVSTEVKKRPLKEKEDQNEVRVVFNVKIANNLYGYFM